MFFYDDDLKIKEHLLELYPDKNLVRIKNHKLLNNWIDRRRLALGVSKLEYLTELGFNYSTPDHGVKISEESIKSYLDDFYPNGLIPHIGDINVCKPKVYTYIHDYCLSNNISKVDYLDNLGFILKSKVKSKNGSEKTKVLFENCLFCDTTRTRNKYNLEALYKLKNMYDANLSEISNLIGISRQALNKTLVNYTDSLASFVYENIDEEIFYNFEPEILTIIITMIDNYEVTYDKDNIFVKIYCPTKNGKACILYKYNNNIRCIFSISDTDIDEALENHMYNRLNEKDLDLLNRINKNDNLVAYSTWNKKETKIKIESDSLLTLVNANKGKYELEKDDYLQFIGINSYTKRDEVESRTYNKILKYVDSGGIFNLSNKIDNYNAIYVNFFKEISNLGLKSLKELVEYFGFIYIRTSDRGTEDKHTLIICERYVVLDNKIYIHSEDHFYNCITSTAKNRGLSIDNYIKKLGFVRLKKNEVPEGYEYYKWNDKDNNTLLTKFSTLIQVISFNDNEVYLDTGSYQYKMLWKYSYLLNQNLNDLILVHGYKRVYKPIVTKEISEKDKSKFSIKDIEENIKVQILNELDSLDVSSSRIIEITNKASRNYKLPRLLKKLYSHKCQLCEKDNPIIPVIEMEEHEYVEVHHIDELGNLKNVIDESDTELDSYKNCLVVCCFHHKYLHYHHGGFKILKKLSNKLVLESTQGDIIPIITNYHLSI